MLSRIRADRQIQGIICIILGAWALSTQDVVIKWMSGTYPLHEIVLARASIAMTLTLVVVHFESGLGGLKTRHLMPLIGRGLLLVVANMSYFLALATMQLAEAMAIFFIGPLFITILSVPFLGEKVGPVRWCAVIMGLAGVIVMLRPGDGVIQVIALLPVLAAFCYASMQIITRRIGITYKASTLAFYIHFTFVIASGTIGLALGDGRFAGSSNPSLEFLFRAWVMPSQQDALLMLLCGSLAAIGGYMISQAYRLAEATSIAPFEYSALPLAIIWGIVIWGDWPDLVSVAGILLIVGGGLFVFYRESIKGRQVAVRKAEVQPDR
ncbi:DMT family transporter [Pelagibius sp. Alg239-R121]|uniref:DMT family transporter n=1 Tax=Pelagibius sp. Alg239-R121 TaxID=2993448 RepID=UPI0024A6DBF2|nr:DMT family transporter [Pelagibius sp. Alg239-R121]